MQNCEKDLACTVDQTERKDGASHALADKRFEHTLAEGLCEG